MTPEAAMLDIANDIHSLSHFKRKTAEVMKRMKKTGNPVVLTINGKAEVVNLRLCRSHRRHSARARGTHEHSVH
jgi:hypothetical protein